MAHTQKIRFFFQAPGVTLQDRTRLKVFIEKIFQQEKIKLAGLNYIFCSDKYLLKINQDYLGHDYFTDIVTFDLSDNPKQIQGEIYISVDRVRENAKKLGVSLKTELHRVIFHGVLHLCGYGDKSAQDLKKMREKEDFLLARYFR